MSALIIPARRTFVDTGLDVATGQVLHVRAEGTWTDLWFVSGPEGYPTPGYMRGYETRLRCQGARFFELIGCVDRDESTNFPIGARSTVAASATGRLYLFANDVPGFYWNNWGALKVEIPEPVKAA